MITNECAGCIHLLVNRISDNIVIMNFASRQSHGGGYLRGAVAQESRRRFV